MWKTALIMFFILISAIGSMLFWQWSAYSSENDLLLGETLEKVEQQITVESKGERLEVIQKVIGLNSGKEYRIIVPDSITEWSCIKEDKSSCESKDENPYTFYPENGSLTVQYQIQLNKGNSPLLLNDWACNFPDVSVQKTSMEIVDSSRREGSWVAGTSLKGFKEFENIDFYVFEGEGSTPSLFWYPTSLAKSSLHKGMAFYLNEEGDKPSYTFETLKAIHHLPHLTVVFTEQYPETYGKGLIIVKPEIENAALERKIIYSYFLNKFESLPLEERWLIDVLTSLFVDEESKVQKGVELIGELKRYFSNEEIAKFLNKLINEETTLSIQKLDELVQSIKGKSTHFFTLNKNETTKLVPLYYYDSRKISIKGAVQEEIEAIYYQDEHLFPFSETMTSLGFDVRVLSDQETLLLSKGNNNYRFYANQSIFIYNEEDYGLLEKPLTTLNGKIYMKDQWLQSIFKVSIDEEEGQIMLSPLID